LVNYEIDILEAIENEEPAMRQCVYTS